MINPNFNLDADPQKGEEEIVLSDKGLDELRRSLAGKVVGPKDTEYDPHNILRRNQNIPPICGGVAVLARS